MFNDQDENHLYKNLYLREEAPPHPGEILRDDILPLLGLSRIKVARALGIGQPRLASLIAGKSPVTLDLAQRLGFVFGHGPRYWLGLQMQHDLWHAAQPVNFALTPIDWGHVIRKKAKSKASRAGTALRS